MNKTVLNKQEYYDFILANDDRTFVRDYEAFKVFYIDVTLDLCSSIATPQSEDIVLKNISLTGYDNFYINYGDGTIDTGVTITILSGDTLCLHEVSGYTKNLVYNTHHMTGYNALDGGFYQGAYKLYGYPIEYMANRMRLGWTTNVMLHLPLSRITTGITLNDIFNNDGFVFYLGTRAENKFSDLTNVEVSILKDAYSFTFVDTQNLYSKDYYELNGTSYDGYFNTKDGIAYSGRTYDSISPARLEYSEKYKDIIDNAFGVRITTDGRIGYRTVYATDICYTGATQDVTGITINSFVDFTSECDDFTVGKIITKYFTIEESYTKTPVINQTHSKYVFVSTIFERDFSYDTKCQLQYGQYKNGTLSIALNGFVVYRNHNVREVIPHELEIESKYQESVPFNISFGGGTQGLYEAIYLDPEKSLDSILQNFFAGTFEGGVTFIEMYSIPLYITEIRDIITNDLESYNLYYPIGGRRVYIELMGSTPVTTIYYIYATTVSIDVVTIQPFKPITSGSFQLIKLFGETGHYKQVIEIPAFYDLLEITYYNTMTDSWSTVNKISDFTITSIIKDDINYNRYTYNKSRRGEILIKLLF